MYGTYNNVYGKKASDMSMRATGGGNAGIVATVSSALSHAEKGVPLSVPLTYHQPSLDLVNRNLLKEDGPTYSDYRQTISRLSSDNVLPQRSYDNPLVPRQFNKQLEFNMLMKEKSGLSSGDKLMKVLDPRLPLGGVVVELEELLNLINVHLKTPCASCIRYKFIEINAILDEALNMDEKRKYISTVNRVKLDINFLQNLFMDALRQNDAAPRVFQDLKHNTQRTMMGLVEMLNH